MADIELRFEKASELRRRATEVLVKNRFQLPYDLKVLSCEDTEKILHELQTYQIELEMQNEELRRSQEELDAAKARYFDFYDLTPVGYISVSAAGVIREANLTAAAMVGVARGALTKQALHRFILAEDRALYQRKLKNLMKTHQQQAFDLRLLRADASSFWSYAQLSSTNHDEYRLTLTDISERKQAEVEKEVMLKEIHHRVKNNLMVVYSLLSLQAKEICDPTAQAILGESRDRIMSMALIHERLYQASDLSHIDFKEYLQGLVDHIAETHRLPTVNIVVAMERITLDVNQGIPCGLIVTELVSNSLKHAFPQGRAGTIKLGISSNSTGDYLLTVEDNGIGFPEEVDFRTTTSLGLGIVIGLTSQLHGTIELSRREGTRFCVTFPGTL